MECKQLIKNLPVFSSKEKLEEKLKSNKRINVADIAEIAIDKKHHESIKELVKIRLGKRYYESIKEVYYVLGRTPGSQIFPYPQSDVNIYVVKQIRLGTMLEKRHIDSRSKYVGFEKVDIKEIKLLNTYNIQLYKSLIK
jgi:hypothetical protein